MFAPIRSIHDYLTEEDKQNFWARVRKGGPDDCWPYANYQEYGVAYIRGRTFTAHRVAWVIANGREIPEGMFICHSCDVRPCVNPAHLWLGTSADNGRDTHAKGRQPHGYHTEATAGALAKVPLSQRSKVALAKWGEVRAGSERERLERRARWLKRMGMT